MRWSSSPGVSHMRASSFISQRHNLPIVIAVRPQILSDPSKGADWLVSPPVGLSPDVLTFRHAELASTSLFGNADVGPAQVREVCAVDTTGKALLRAAMEAHAYAWAHVRAAAHERDARKARATIADMAGSDGIQAPHLAEAIQYRPRRMG